VALGATFVASASAAPAGAHARAADLNTAAAVQTRTIVLRRRALAAHGLYAVRVTITDGSAAIPLRVAVSNTRTKLVTLKHERAVLTTHAWSRNHAIVVRVTGKLTGRPRLRLALRHLATSRVLVLHKSLSKPGTYAVRVTVSGHSSATNDVSLKIGRAAPALVKVSRHAAATVTADVQAAGSYGVPRVGHLHFRSVLTVSASGKLTRPRVTIELAKLKKSGPNVAPAVTASVPSGPSGPMVPTGDSGTWNLIFDDEFNGSSLNTADWSTGWFGSGITAGVDGTGEPECYDPSHVVEANGELDLNFTQGSETCEGVTQPYTSGIVTSDNKFSFSYGFIEVRAWLPTMPNGQAGDWPGVWLAGQDWPEDGEIDLAEGLGGSVCAHWHGPTGNGTGYGPGGTGCPSGTYTGGWHTFAADWEPGIVTWYYDGKDIGCIASTGSACGNPNNDSTITSSPMYIIFGLGSNAGSEYAPTSQRMDYVRVWQH